MNYNYMQLLSSSTYQGQWMTFGLDIWINELYTRALCQLNSHTTTTTPTGQLTTDLTSTPETPESPVLLCPSNGSLTLTERSSQCVGQSSPCCHPVGPVLSHLAAVATLILCFIGSAGNIFSIAALSNNILHNYHENIRMVHSHWSPGLLVKYRHGGNVWRIS